MMVRPEQRDTRVIRRPRLKVSKACQGCRLRKIKCDSSRPACSTCQTRRKICTYSSTSTTSEDNNKLTHKLVLEQPPNELSAIASPPVSPPNSRRASLVPTALAPTAIHSYLQAPAGPSEHESPNPTRAGYAAHGQFAGHVAAAIDERAGFNPPNLPSVIPLVDAPLFGDLDLLSTGSSTSPISTEMPDRAVADQLVHIYWRYLDPAEPILDRRQFSEYYAASYSISCVSHIQQSIIYCVLALAMQRQESIPLTERNTAGNTYFRRAWSLFPAESILWEPRSLEQVQCLMIMNRYLHCTNNQPKTWMTAGLAMRIAQNMCSHPSETSSVDGLNSLKRKVWASCVSLDRCVSWSLGKTSAITLIPSLKSCQTQEAGDTSTDMSYLNMELHEIGNQIQLAQVQTGNTLAARSVARTQGQQEEYHTAAVHLDSCLDKLETSLPSDLQFRSIEYLKDRTAQMERYLLHIRLLHSRIYLYRPILARFYSMKNDCQLKSINFSSLSERVLREGAKMCVEAAQAVTSLIVETLNFSHEIGIIPWWTRIYYLHIAGTIFLAAMVKSELFTDSVSQSWQLVLTTLRAHVHLSTYVQQCMWTFEALSARTSQTDCIKSQNEGEHLIDNPDCHFDNIFEDIQFDFDEFLFGTEDMINLDAIL